MQPLTVYTEQVIVMVCFLILKYDHLYLCVTDVDKNSVVLQNGETMAFRLPSPVHERCRGGCSSDWKSCYS